MSMGDPNKGLLEKGMGRIKRAIGELTGDAGLKQEGAEEKHRGRTREELAEAEEEVERKARDVAESERRETARR